MNTHKMGCMNNAVCAVYHADGKCPGYNVGCTCGADSKTTYNDSWEERFDEVFLKTMYQDDGYSEERAVLKDFIRTQIAAAEKRKVAEIRGIIEGEKYTSHLETAKRHPTVPWNECEACIQNYHYNMALDRILSLLQAPTKGEYAIEEGVYYPESKALDCCEKCGDVHFEKTYPAHTAYYACTNLACPCHLQADNETGV